MPIAKLLARPWIWSFLGAALVWLAGRIYGNAVTRTGAKVKLADALRPI